MKISNYKILRHNFVPFSLEMHQSTEIETNGIPPKEIPLFDILSFWHIFMMIT